MRLSHFPRICMGTDFQQKTVRDIVELANRRCSSVESRLVHGATESYFVLHLSCGERNVEVYVYIDEAGFFYRGEWHMYEHCDFDSLSSLEAAILRDIEGLMGPALGNPPA